MGIRARAFGCDGLLSAVIAAVTLVVCLACGSGDPADEIQFAQPTFYVVQQGDDVARIARIHKVDVAEVLDWNNLTTDAPDVGSTLLIWPHGQHATSGGAVASAPSPGSSGGRSAPRPRPASGGAPPPPVDEAEAPDRPTSVRGAGLLGADDPSSDLDLAAAASGLEGRRGKPGEAGLGDNSALASGGEAEGLQMEERRTVQPTGPQIPNTPVTPPRVARPAAKKCLSGAVTSVDEDGMVRESGLNTGQITAGMAAISKFTPKCFPSGTLGTYSMVVEVTVGCDGRVSNVYTISPGAIPPPVTSCIEQTVAAAGFAAHGVPDGMSFQYPMKFKF